jgi:hypothetical protein
LTLNIWDKLSLWGSVNVEIRLDLLLVDHVLFVRELTPQFLVLLLNLVLHLLLLLHQHLLLLHVHATHLALFLGFSLFHLLVADELHLPSAFHFFNFLLLLHHHWIGLHVHGDNQGGKSVTTNNASVKVDVLRSDLNVLAVGVFELLGIGTRSVHQ